MHALSQLSIENDTKLILLVIDGLGGLADPATGLTELETAKTPNLDSLMKTSTCGLLHAVGPGVTPGSGPGHLALFGYDPVMFEIGRGALSATGVGIELGPDDVAARVNFCTVADGNVTDRRAGRISTEENARLCSKLGVMEIEGVALTIKPEKDHRAALVLRGRGLSESVTDTDPQLVGVAPLQCEPLPEGGIEAVKTARLVNAYIEKAAEILADEHPANMILARGFAKLPQIPKLEDLYKLKAIGIADYPMYRAMAKLVGMHVAEVGGSASEKVEVMEKVWDGHDYFFVHYKKADAAGEDGDFARKVKCIEEVDAEIPRILALQPDVFVVTGDHSTPALLKAHSWHPSPVLFHSPLERRDDVEEFGETACARGGLGTMMAVQIMTLMLSNGRRLEKYGA